MVVLFSPKILGLNTEISGLFLGSVGQCVCVCVCVFFFFLYYY